MRSAISLNRQLRALGVPLPELLAAHADDVFPWMLLEMLSGTDLGNIVGDLSPGSRREIAVAVAAAQAQVATLPSSGRYGYASVPEAAPFERWSGVVEAHVERSRRRIVAAGLVDPELVVRIERPLSLLAGELDGIPATPFLHDTTTKNVIVTPEGRLSGIVDVDDLCYGDPRYVAALTSVALRAHGHPTDYAGELMRAAGWRDDALYRLYVAVFVLDFMSEHGQVFNGNAPVSSGQARKALAELYDEALRELRTGRQ